MEFCACHFCKHGSVVAAGDEHAIWAECQNCGATGPKIAKGRADRERQCVAAWNSIRNFGRIAIANVPTSITSQCAAVAARLQLLSESVMAGEYGNVDGLAVTFRTRTATGQVQATLSLHGLSDGDARAILTAVTDAQRARAVAFSNRPSS